MLPLYNIPHYPTKAIRCEFTVISYQFIATRNDSGNFERKTVKISYERVVPNIMLC